MWEHTYYALFEASHRFLSNSAVEPDLALCMYTLNKHRQKCNLLFNFYLTQQGKQADGAVEGDAEQRAQWLTNMRRLQHG